MKVTRLKLTNIRAIETADLRFRPGFNLVAGINGVGKTTVLDALAVCLSAVIRRANVLRGHFVRFNVNDIRRGTEILDIVCDVEHGEEYGYGRYTIATPLSIAAQRVENEDLLRKETHLTFEMKGFIGKTPSTVGRPLSTLFSTRRAVPSRRKPTVRAAAGGVESAFSSALSDRQLRLRELEAWMRAQDALKPELPAAGRILDAMEEAVTRFLPDYRNLRPGGTGAILGNLLIDHGTTTLRVQELSDGERGVLAMVLDLTRRLARANPEMKDPAAEAEAVVLIDEIELHLHPGWQRRIVGNLTKTFPKCQFIATTHSPQVIGEVEHDRIHIIADGEVYSPLHSFGVDSSRVLEEIMDTPPRTGTVNDLLSRISRTIGDDRYDDARALLDDLSSRLGENDPEVTRIRTLLDFMTGDA